MSKSDICFYIYQTSINTTRSTYTSVINNEWIGNIKHELCRVLTKHDVHLQTYPWQKLTLHSTVLWSAQQNKSICIDKPKKRIEVYSHLQKQNRFLLRQIFLFNDLNLVSTHNLIFDYLSYWEEWESWWNEIWLNCC